MSAETTPFSQRIRNAIYLLFFFVCGTAAIRRMRRNEAQLTPIMRPMRAVETAERVQSEIKLVEINTTHWCNLSADEDVEKRKGNFAVLHLQFTNWRSFVFRVIDVGLLTWVDRWWHRDPSTYHFVHSYVTSSSFRVSRKTNRTRSRNNMSNRVEFTNSKSSYVCRVKITWILLYELIGYRIRRTQLQLK